MSVRRHILVACIVALCCTSPIVAQEDEKPSDVDAARAALSKAQSEYADASAAVSKAEVARMRLEKSIRMEFLNKPDLLEARHQAHMLTRYYNELRNAVRKELEQDPDYREKLAAVSDAEQALRVANAAKSARLSQTLTLMHGLMSARAELTRFESAAFALDPAIEDARLAMNSAYELVNKLERGYAAMASGDPRSKSAVDELVHAKERVDRARAALSSASEKLAAASQVEALRNADRRMDLPPIHRPEP